MTELAVLQLHKIPAVLSNISITAERDPNFAVSSAAPIHLDW